MQKETGFESEYAFTSSEPSHTHRYLWKPVLDILKSESKSGTGLRVLDLGCGNGAFAGELKRHGYSVVGIDPSQSGITHAKGYWPGLEFHVGSAYDDLPTKLGCFDAIVSLEMVEHLYSPRDFARNIYALLRPGGVAVVTTPYHGYLKNLAMAVTGTMDAHFTALWDHGHIKFWSTKTLRMLLSEVGMSDIGFLFAGRSWPLYKSMIAVCRKPR